MFGSLNVPLILVLGLAITEGQISTLICQTCNWPNDADCFDGTALSTSACPYQESLMPYCLSRFSITDGIVTAISRGCELPSSDSDVTTDYMPTNPECDSAHDVTNTDVTEQTTCYYSCNNTNNCNNNHPRLLKTCLNCVMGQCNYVTGICECQDGYSGPNCTVGVAPSPQTFLSCVQCSEEEDSGCRNAPTSQGTICGSASDAYCATSVTTTYDEGGVQVRSTVTRSCSSDYVASDECFITNSDNPYDGYVQYTCVSTCETDNCNTGIPDGLIENGESLQPTYCYQCTSTSDGSPCALASPSLLTRCPSNQRYCTSTAVYYLSDKVDTNSPAEPGYLFSSITRNCSDSQVSPSCQETAVGGSSLRKYTCTETCTGDRCNDRWPARPKCAVCSSSSCLADPGSPVPCDFPYQRYCYFQELNRPKDISSRNYEPYIHGYSRSIERGCTYHSYGTVCVDNSYGDGTTKNCNKTCSTDGCNLGFTDSAAPRSGSILLTMMTFLVTSGRLFC